jgi:hypothetical protein
MKQTAELLNVIADGIYRDSFTFCKITCKYLFILICIKENWMYGKDKKPLLCSISTVSKSGQSSKGINTVFSGCYSMWTGST